MSHFLRCKLAKRGWKAPSSAWEEGRGTRRLNLSEASPLRRLQSSRRGRLFPRSCAAASLRAESPSFPVLANEREGTALSISLGYFRRESPSSATPAEWGRMLRLSRRSSQSTTTQAWLSPRDTKEHLFGPSIVRCTFPGIAFSLKLLPEQNKLTFSLSTNRRVQLTNQYSLSTKLRYRETKSLCTKKRACGNNNNNHKSYTARFHYWA